MSFICDVMLGKLAKYLRLLGFDTLYIRSPEGLKDHEYLDGQRYYLTRRRKKTGYERTVYIRSELPLEQLKEIKELIRPHVKPEAMLNRCIECNRQLVDVDKRDVEALVPEFVFHNYGQFKVCPSCKRVYWEGSHTVSISHMLKEVLD